MKKYLVLLLPLFFFFAATYLLVSGIQNNVEYKQVGKDEVKVTATITEIVEHEGYDYVDYDVFFTYTYDGEKYEYNYPNYPGPRKVGHQTDGYICPDNPSELFIPTGNGTIIGAILIYVFAFGGGLFLAVMFVRRKERPTTPSDGVVATHNK